MSIDTEYAQGGTSWARVPAGPRHATGSPRARAERVELTPGLGEPLAGYGIDVAERRARGWLGGLYALVLLTDDGVGVRRAVLALDLHAGSRWIAELVARQTAQAVGTSIDRLFVAAAHTHSGPGGIYGSRFYDHQLTSLECTGAHSPFVEAAAKALSDAVLRLSQALDQDLHAPSTLEYRESVVWGVAWQRALAAHLHNYADPTQLNLVALTNLATQTSSTFTTAPPPLLSTVGNDPRFLAVDPRVRCLAWNLSTPAAPPAVVAFVNVTPTLLGPEARVLTSDVFGMAARHAERLLDARPGATPGASVALMAGAHGDTFVVDPSLGLAGVQQLRKSAGDASSHHDSLAALARQAERLGDALYRALTDPFPPHHLHLVPAPASLLFDEATHAGCPAPPLALHMAIGAGMLYGNDFDAPSGLPLALLQCATLGNPPFPKPGPGTAWPPEFGAGHPNAHPPPGDPQAPKLDLDLADSLTGADGAGALTPWVTSRLMTFAGANNGPSLVVAGVPFEATTMAAWRLESALRPAGGQALVASLAGDYLGYLTTPAEYDVQQYEGGSTWLGRATLDWVALQLQRMVTTGANPPRPSAVFSSLASDTKAPVDLLGFPNLGAAPPVALTVLPPVASMPGWLRLEGGWPAEYGVLPPGTPSAVAPTPPGLARPWLRFLLGSSPAGPFATAMLDAHTPLDERCGWMLLRREAHYSLAHRVHWRWTLCLRAPAAWSGKWLTFEVLCQELGVRYTGARPAAVRLP